MKKYLLLLLFYISSFTALVAQNSNLCYTDLRREGLRLLEKKDYRNAVDKFFAARYCPDKPVKDDLDDLIKRTQNQWVKALDDAKKAADRALAKADSLIAYFGFAQDRAWAYKNGKFAVIDRSGKRLTDFEFENPEPFKQSGYAIAQKADGFYYLIDKAGKVSEPYNYFFPCNNGWYKVKKGNLYTFYDKNYKQVEGWEWYKWINNFSQDVVFIKKNDKLNLATKDGQIIAITAQFDTIFPFISHGVFKIKKDGKWGLLNKKGMELFSPQFDEIYSDFDEQFIFGQVIKVRIGAKWGVINKMGEIMIIPQFDKISNFYEGIASYQKEEKWGYINDRGEFITPLLFEEASDFAFGFARVKLNNESKRIDKSGKFYPLFEAHSSDFFVNELAWDRDSSGKWGLIDSNDVFYFPPTFDYVYDLSDSITLVCMDKKWGVISRDEAHKFVIHPQFDKVETTFDSNIILVEINTQKGLINQSGEILFVPQFDYISSFNGDIAAVEKNGKWGFVNKRGQVIVEPQYDNTTGFKGEMAAVERENKWGFINRKGEIVIPNQFDHITRFHNGANRVRKFEEFFHINYKGELIVDETLESQKE